MAGLQFSETRKVAQTCSTNRNRRAGFAAALLILGACPAAADPVAVATTAGSGTLTTCRSWIVYNSCETHRVALPERIALGDDIHLRFGANAKTYTFHVVHIRREGDGCTILSDASAGKENGEKLEIAPCQVAAKPTDTR
jgi:hypothetical protein